MGLGKDSAQWGTILNALTQSKNSIMAAAEFALSRPEHSTELMAAVVALMNGSTVHKHRLAALFLVDCICQRSWRSAERSDAAAPAGSPPTSSPFVQSVGAVRVATLALPRSA